MGVTRVGRCPIAIALIVCGCVTVATSVERAGPARADVLTQSNDTLRTGWFPDQPRISPATVSSGTFGRLWAASVDGQVYAQPVVAHGIVVVATESNHVYGLDAATGDQLWTTSLGVAWSPAELGCADLLPTIGVTGTPVIDAATNTAYLFSKTYATGTSGPAAWYAHALDVTTGAERRGFPVLIAGNAANAPARTFTATTQLQRPGLVLLGGIVYAAFGGHCDRPPYTGWVVGVSTSGAITTMWSSTTSDANGGGIWQSGGGLISDGPGRILFATGNGQLALTGPTPGSSPPGDLDEAMARLAVQPDGSLVAKDFFTPYDAATLDLNDLDFGSGGPAALPAEYFGTSLHPHLLVEASKQGFVYLLDRDHLGGYRQGPNGSDGVLQRTGPYGGVWGKAAVWPGDRYVYVATMSAGFPVVSGLLRAFKYGVDGAGNPTLTLAGSSSDPFGFGSGSPIVTSDGTTAGSALVWVVWNADGTGVNAQLRAYDAVPSDGRLTLRWSTPIGTASKFAVPAVDSNRIYVGTRDGRVQAFGSPVTGPLTASPSLLGFPTTVIGASSSLDVSFVAAEPVTITALDSDSAAFELGNPSMPLPASLPAGASLTVPVTFTPTKTGLASATITATADAGTTTVGAWGSGQSATALLTAYPLQLSLGGAPVLTGATSGSATFANSGATPLTITSVTLPQAPFSAAGAPASGTVLGPGASITITITFRPTTTGAFSDAITLASTAGTVTMPITASSSLPQRMLIGPAATDLGRVRLGETRRASFLLWNVGGSPLAITKSKPPAAGVGFEAETSLPEGSTLAPGAFAVETVRFTARTEGLVSDQWTVTADDGSGRHDILFSASAARSTGYWMLGVDGEVFPFGDATSYGPVPLAGVPAVELEPTPSGHGYWVLDGSGHVFAYGDAPYLGGVDASRLGPGEHAAGLSATPSGAGYRIVTNFGRVLAFGDARSFGDVLGRPLNGDIVGSIATTSGNGYYMVGSDGGVFAFGDAPFLGSMGGVALHGPVVGIVATAGAGGYWLVARDGGVFAFGAAPFLGSMGGVPLNQPVCAMATYGDGYLMVANDGGVFDFGGRPFLGSLAANPPSRPIVSVGAWTG